MLPLMGGGNLMMTRPASGGLQFGGRADEVEGRGDTDEAEACRLLCFSSKVRCSSFLLPPASGAILSWPFDRQRSPVFNWVVAFVFT